MLTEERVKLRDKKRVVIKIGSSSLTHVETGDLNLMKIEKLIRVISDMKGQGKEVVLVSSGAIAAGRQALGHHQKPTSISQKQAFAAVGQARLMMVYQKLFAEYNQTAAQVLMTKDTMVNDASRYNAQNTFEELLKMGAIPIVNENDTVSTSEIPLVDNFGDNDRLSAIVAALIGADLLILLSDIDGLYSDDPHANPDAKFIDIVSEITPQLMSMGKSTSGSDVGTGGMAAKLVAARIATDGGSDMVIANGDDVEVICQIMEGQDKGTLFMAHNNLDFDLMHYINNEY
ncbi:glutamate 5-kinase [Clostridium sp. chh4-2]|uniref:glutamate 5-kinase n=1 Tax=Clostridium sp. chh4-2 TaxID=2067550 RepID=UPI000CCF8F25|nr:glutamate 5-kinase [Clostridium sp. chh4-2]PNV59747.1 glutamate 5-kinase [Clostridium sp. chh4-2]